MLSMQQTSIRSQEYDARQTCNANEAIYYQNAFPSLNQLSWSLSSYCLCDLSGTGLSSNQQVANVDCISYWKRPIVHLPNPYESETLEGSRVNAWCNNDQAEALKLNNTFFSNTCSDSSPQISKPETEDYSSDTLNKGKRDMINYEALEGHQYEIRSNPNKDQEKNTRVFVCKYDNWNKVFSKTWNLVYHFRVHTREKPFICEECHKGFTQRSNLTRHIQRHERNRKLGKVLHKWTDCYRSYSSIYNLRVSFKSLASSFVLNSSLLSISNGFL